MNSKEFFGDWSKVIPFEELDKLLPQLNELLQTVTLCPEPKLLFQCFKQCDYNKLKVVFLGQSPYHQKNVATGLCFANKKDTKKLSSSLQKLKDAVELYCTDDLPFSTIDEVFPTLESWANQGILMLNSSLTTQLGDTGGHFLLWRGFVQKLFENIAKDKPDTIFVLFGNIAQSFSLFIKKYNYICVPHPAYCAREGKDLPNFFKEIDDLMLKKQQKLIYWI